MKELQMFEQELLLIQDNIKRLKEYKNNDENKKYKPYHSHVVGELKHRLTALKQRITLVNNITTYDLFKN